MADITVTAGLPAPTRYRDNGDGSFTPMVASVPLFRGTEILHRSGITTPDTLALPGTLTLSAITEAGSTLANVAYTVGVAAGNRWGTTGPGTLPGAITPTAAQAVRCAFAQVVGADYYDVFLSTAPAPLWVGRITEAQRATGDQIISTVGVVSARAGATVAGTIDIGIVGTGVATTAAPFNVNSALTPAAITPIDFQGYSNMLAMVKVTVTDLRVAPSLVTRVMVKSVLSPNDWFALATAVSAPLATSAATPLEFYLNLAMNGARGGVVTLSAFSSNIASVDVWVAAI